MTPEAKLDVANAAKVEAAQAAQKYGIAIDIPEIDPGGGRLRKLTEPDDMLKALSTRNKGKAEMALKQDVGIEPQRPLNLAAVNENLERLSGPKRQIESMNGFFDDGTVVREVRALVPERTVGMGKEHATAVGEVARIIDDVTEGVGVGSGRNIMSSIESLRKAARDIYGRDEITPELRNTANIYKGTANALEGLIERRLGATFPDLSGAYRQNREAMAKTYLLRDILDDNTQTVNLKQLAKQTAQDEGITGAFRDFAKIYANSPESFRVGPKEGKKFHASRYTVGGGAGAILGSPFGPVGAMVGAGAGTLISDLVAGAAARKLASPKHQQGYIDALRRKQPPRGPEPIVTPDEGLPFLPRIEDAPPVVPGSWREGAPQSAPLPALMDDMGNPLPTAPASAELGGLEVPMTGQFSPWTPGQVPGKMDAAASEAARLAALRAEMLERVGTDAGAGGGMRQPTQLPQKPTPTPQMPAVEMPLTPDMAKSYLSAIMEAMQRGDMETVATLERQFNAAQQALQSQQPHAAHNLLYEPFRRR